MTIRAEVGRDFRRGGKKKILKKSFNSRLKNFINSNHKFVDFCLAKR
jgi:hypothetical protein